VSRWLLVSDVDRALLGDDPGLEEFAAWVAPRRERLTLCYSSGRFVDSVALSVEATSLPEPDWITGGVGTELASFPGRDLEAGWTATLEGGWDADAAAAAARAACPRLEDQPEEFQSRFKRSFYLHDAAPGELAGIEEALRDTALAVKMVYSSQRDLDLLPAAADKGRAARYLAWSLGIPPAQVVVAGDSGNDRALFEQGFQGVVVANAHAELQAMAGPSVHLASRPCAGGVLEGLARWMGEDETER